MLRANLKYKCYDLIASLRGEVYETLDCATVKYKHSKFFTKLISNAHASSTHVQLLLNIHSQRIVNVCSLYNRRCFL